LYRQAVSGGGGLEPGAESTGEQDVADTDSNHDGIADFIQGRQSAKDAGLTVSTPAHVYFTKYFDAYREALVKQRDNISNFAPLPDIITYTSATKTNEQLTKIAPGQVVDVINQYIAYLDEYKSQVDRAIKEIQAQDQA
jgi:hypothetical protein